MYASNKFEIKLYFFVRSTSTEIAERRESGEFSELVRIACSCAFRHRANNDEKQGHVSKEARLPSRTVSPILFPYNLENSIPLLPGILTRPIFRGGGAPKERRVTNDGVGAGVHEFGTNLPN